MLPIVLFTLTRLDTATTSGGTLRPSNRRECLSLATQECRSQHKAIDFHGEGKEGNQESTKRGIRVWYGAYGNEEMSEAKRKSQPLSSAGCTLCSVGSGSFKASTGPSQNKKQNSYNENNSKTQRLMAADQGTSPYVVGCCFGFGLWLGTHHTIA